MRLCVTSTGKEIEANVDARFDHFIYEFNSFSRKGVKKNEKYSSNH